jgi:phospholipase C
MENESLPMIVGSPNAPYQTALARSCGLATNYYAVTHPSLPNYLAATGGSTFGVVDDAEPSAHPLSASSIFSQISAARESWKGYAESMPKACDLVTSGAYAARHNPAVYYTNIRGACAHDDVPLGSISNGAFAKAARSAQLPNFSFVIPNICDDAHSCSIAHGDRWLEQFLPTLFSSPQYRRGEVALFLAYDEGSGDNRVATVVASPSVPTGVVSTVRYTHYSLLRSTEELLGLVPLRAAAKAASMVSAFNL